MSNLFELFAYLLKALVSAIRLALNLVLMLGLPLAGTLFAIIVACLLFLGFRRRGGKPASVTPAPQTGTTSPSMPDVLVTAPPEGAQPVVPKP